MRRLLVLFSCVLLVGSSTVHRDAPPFATPITFETVEHQHGCPHLVLTLHADGTALTSMSSDHWQVSAWAARWSYDPNVHRLTLQGENASNSFVLGTANTLVEFARLPRCTLLPQPYVLEFAPEISAATLTSDTWLLKAAGKSVDLHSIVWVRFGTDGSVIGETNCSSVSARYEARGNALRFSGLRSTAEHCNNGDELVARALVAVLDDTRTVHTCRCNWLDLKDAQGKEIAHFTSARF